MASSIQIRRVRDGNHGRVAGSTVLSQERHVRSGQTGQDRRNRLKHSDGVGDLRRSASSIRVSWTRIVSPNARETLSDWSWAPRRRQKRPRVVSGDIKAACLFMLKSKTAGFPKAGADWTRMGNRAVRTDLSKTTCSNKLDDSLPVPSEPVRATATLQSNIARRL